MKEAVLIIIKPEGMVRRIIGDIFKMFSTSQLELIGIRMIQVDRKKAAIHYEHIKGKPFYGRLMSHFMGKYHGCNRLLAFVYYGQDAIKKCRRIAGATNPLEAKPQTIRGKFGRVTKKDVYENVVHVSSNGREAKREIQLWFEPGDIVVNIYKTKKRKSGINTEAVWA